MDKASSFKNIETQHLFSAHDFFHQLSNLSSVVIHLNLLDLENSILLGRTSTPALVAVRPVVPDPGTRHVGHVFLGRPLLDAINVEGDQVGGPVNSVLVLGGGGVGGREDGLVRRLSITVAILVSEPKMSDAAIVGLGLGVREPLDIGLLGVGLVEEHSCKLLVTTS